MSTRTNPGEGAFPFPFTFLENPHSEESWADSLLPREHSQSCRRESGAVNPCLTWVPLPRAPALPAWLFWDASSLLPWSPPREWLLLPTHGKGRLGSEPEVCAAAWGCSWHPLGIEVSLSDSTEAWETPAQSRVFLPFGCLLSLQERQRETASSGSCVVKNCGQRFCLKCISAGSAAVFG